MNKRILLRIAAVLAAASPILAQAPQAAQANSIKGVVKYNKVPVATDVIKVKLPRPVEQPLANGLKLLVVESHRVPSISLRIVLPTGSLRDPAGVPGLADATAALIRQGTKTRSSKEIVETLAEIGASLNFNSGQGDGSISLSCMTENFDAALAVLSDVLLNPTFPEDELEKWKTRQRAQLEQAKAQPGFVANDQMMKVLYGSDARQYSHPTAASLEKITREAILEHYRKYYVPAGQWAGISGDITPAEAVAKLNKVLGGWKGGPIERVSLPLPAPIAEKKIYLIPRPNSVQTLLMIANHAIERNNPDYVACQVMNRVLGAGPSSRLFRIVREEKGYTYGIGSNFQASHVYAFFATSTSVRTEVTEPALTEILSQFADIRDRAVPADELADAKSAIVASFVLGLESSASVLSQWMTQREFNLPEDYWDTYPQKIMAISAEDVARVARKYVPVSNAQIIVVGDTTKIGDLLKKFGPVEEVTVN